MTNEQKIAVLEALKLYLPIAAPCKSDKHIELLEEVVAELESEIIPPPDSQDLFDDSI